MATAVGVKELITSNRLSDSQIQTVSEGTIHSTNFVN